MTGRRVAAFGYHAGFAGAAIGLDVWAQQILHPKQKYPSIDPYSNEDDLIKHIKNRLNGAGIVFIKFIMYFYIYVFLMYIILIMLLK